MRRYSSLYLKAEMPYNYMALWFVFLKTVKHIKLIVFLHTFTTMMIIIRSLAKERGGKLLHLRKPSTKKVILLANYQAEKKMGTTLWHKTLMVKKIEDSSKCHVEM